MPLKLVAFTLPVTLSTLAAALNVNAPLSETCLPDPTRATRLAVRFCPIRLPPVTLPAALTVPPMAAVTPITLLAVTLPTMLSPESLTVPRIRLVLLVPPVNKFMTLAAVCVPITRLPPFTYM